MADLNPISFPPVGMLPSLGMIDEATTDSPLGFKDRYTLNDWSLMGAGDILLLHTDGLAEHRHGEQDYFPNRVEQTVRRVKDGPARAITRRSGKTSSRSASLPTTCRRGHRQRPADWVEMRPKVSQALEQFCGLVRGVLFSRSVAEVPSRLAQRCRSTMSLILILRSGGSSRGNVSQLGLTAQDWMPGPRAGRSRPIPPYSAGWRAGPRAPRPWLRSDGSREHCGYDRLPILPVTIMTISTRRMSPPRPPPTAGPPT